MSFYSDLDLDASIRTLKSCKYLDERTILSICSILRAQFLEESTIQPVSTPVTICGDIHGQFWDLLELLRRSDGDSAEIGNYIFMGDFVDRGYYSLETVSLLFTLKARYPNKVTLLRGNHESRQITQVYGFYDECQQKYGSPTVWQACCSVFDYLNLAAIIDGRILCVHGGLSPDIRSLDQIRVLARVQEIPHEGAYCDLMWSDPEEIDTWAVSPRGAGWLFGGRVTHEFCHINSLSLIARAHQLVQEGYKYMFNDALVTVWSAPNYCYRCGNLASVMRLGYDDTRGSSSSQKYATESADSIRDIPKVSWARQSDDISKTFIVYDAAPENHADKVQRAGRMGMSNMQYFV